jgi:hypothetical protein
MFFPLLYLLPKYRTSHCPDCEAILLERGSQQRDLWGASWNPISQEISYESMVNLRPRQNRSMQIIDFTIRSQVQQVIYQLLGGYEQLE